jgi:hypothetical protein
MLSRALLLAVLAVNTPAAMALREIVLVDAGGGVRPHKEDCNFDPASPGISAQTRARAMRFHFEATEPFLAAEREARERLRRSLDEISGNTMRPPAGEPGHPYLRRNQQTGLALTAQASTEAAARRQRYLARFADFLKSVPIEERDQARWVMGARNCTPAPAQPHGT